MRVTEQPGEFAVLLVGDLVVQTGTAQCRAEQLPVVGQLLADGLLRGGHVRIGERQRERVVQRAVCAAGGGQLAGGAGGQQEVRRFEVLRGDLGTQARVPVACHGGEQIGRGRAGRRGHRAEGHIDGRAGDAQQLDGQGLLRGGLSRGQHAGPVQDGEGAGQARVRGAGRCRSQRVRVAELRFKGAERGSGAVEDQGPQRRDLGGAPVLPPGLLHADGPDGLDPVGEGAERFADEVKQVLAASAFDRLAGGSLEAPVEGVDGAAQVAAVGEAGEVRDDVVEGGEVVAFDGRERLAEDAGVAEQDLGDVGRALEAQGPVPGPDLVGGRHDRVQVTFGFGDVRDDAEGLRVEQDALQGALADFFGDRGQVRLDAGREVGEQRTDGRLAGDEGGTHERWDGQQQAGGVGSDGVCVEGVELGAQRSGDGPVLVPDNFRECGDPQRGLPDGSFVVCGADGDCEAEAVVGDEGGEALFDGRFDLRLVELVSSVGSLRCGQLLGDLGCGGEPGDRSCRRWLRCGGQLGDGGVAR